MATLREMPIPADRAGEHSGQSQDGHIERSNPIAAVHQHQLDAALVAVPIPRRLGESLTDEILEQSAVQKHLAAIEASGGRGWREQQELLTPRGNS